MVTVQSLSDLENMLATEKISGVVRLSPPGDKESAHTWSEANRLQSEFPAVPFFFVKGILGDETAEEAAGELLNEFGHDALMLPHYWIVWRGAVAAVYKQSGMIVRDLLSMFGGKDTVESVAQWIEDQLKVERGTGKPKPRPGQPKRKAPAEAPTKDRVQPPHVVLGVRADADEATIRTAYRKLCAQYHPDKYAQAPKDEQDKANRKMTEINAAYEQLKRSGKVK